MQKVKLHHNCKDLTGKRFGKLWVVAYTPQRNRTHSVLWRCMCGCGNEKLLSSAALLHDKTRSCGCVRKAVGRNSIKWQGWGEISLSYFNKIKREATTRGHVWSLDIKYVWRLFLKQGGRCRFSRQPLTFDVSQSAHGRTASLDRIDSMGGYTKGNVQWCHTKLNMMKGALSDQEFIDLCKAVANNN